MYFIVFALVLLITTNISSATHHHDDDDDDYFTKPSFDEYPDEYQDDNEFARKDETESETNNDEVNKTDETTKTATYEVSEAIDDIPNTTPRGPIVTNFTLLIPLNNATNNATDNKLTVPNLKKNTITIFHLNAEFDNNKQDVAVMQNVPNFPNLKAFRDYIHGVKKGIINGLHSWINREQTSTSEVNIDSQGNTPQANIIAAPIVFWDRLHRKGSDAANNVYRAIFGKQFGDDN